MTDHQTDPEGDGLTAPVRVALVNDHEIVVRGLAQMLAPFEDRIHVVELDADSTVDSVVDVALYDTFAVAQVTGSEVDQLLANPRVGAVAVYTWNLSADLVAAARAKGVRGYLSKSLSAAELAKALELVAAGEEVVLPAAEIDSDPAKVPIAGGDWPGRPAGLSARQAEIVSLITQGLSNAEIAERTHLGANTVKSYIRQAYRQMGVTSRTQAVLWGVEHGMAPRPARDDAGD
jgi:DNA-binding NarL/FixJ family response regulator